MKPDEFEWEGYVRRPEILCGEGDPPCDAPVWWKQGVEIRCESDHVIETPPSPRLEGVAHLNYGGGRGEWVDLARLERERRG